MTEKPSHDGPGSCKGCPAHTYGVGFVPPLGKPTAKYAFLGQRPGETEAQIRAEYEALERELQDADARGSPVDEGES